LVITVIAGMSVLSYMPRLLLGGVVVYVGLALLYEWVIQSWSTFPKIDYAIIVSILLMIAIKDLMWGIVLGLILTTILFVINYGRVNPIQIELSGATFRSRVNRGVQHNALLQAQGDQLLIFKLHGFIFFGSANRLFEQLRQSIITRNTSTPTHFVLLDFEHVRGVDSTSMLSFGRLLQFSHANSIELVLTGLTKHIRNQLSHSGFTEQTPNVRIFDDLDRGVEWCEDEIMAGAGADEFIHLDLTQQFAILGLNASAITALIDKMQRREVNTGEHIIRQGDPPDELFLIESGQFTAQLEKAEREPIRLETMHGGCMVGELGFFLGTRRNASVVADCPSVVRVLSQADWAGIIKQDADAAQTLSSLTIYVLGRRVSHLTRAVDALLH